MSTITAQIMFSTAYDLKLAFPQMVTVSDHWQSWLSTAWYTVGHKKVPTKYCKYLHQML